MEQDQEIEELKTEFASSVTLYQNQVEKNGNFHFYHYYLDKSIKKWMKK